MPRLLAKGVCAVAQVTGLAAVAVRATDQCRAVRRRAKVLLCRRLVRMQWHPTVFGWGRFPLYGGALGLIPGTPPLHGMFCTQKPNVSCHARFVRDKVGQLVLGWAGLMASTCHEP